MRWIVLLVDEDVGGIGDRRKVLGTTDEDDIGNLSLELFKHWLWGMTENHTKSKVHEI